MKRRIINYCLFIILGILIGSTVTFVIMNKKEEKNSSGIQEAIMTETKKLLLRNDMYNYVETIEKSIKDILDEDEEIVLKKCNLIFKDNVFMEIDEEEKIVEKGLRIENIPFKSTTPLDNSIITINDKGKIEEATIYVEGFKLHYDFLSVSVESTE